MRAPLCLLLATCAACAAHDPELATKLDNLQAQLAANQRAIEALHQELAHPAATGAAPADTTPPRSAELEKRIDSLDAKLDRVLAATTRNTPPPRPARAEPDRAKVYALKIDGYPSDGPADAKVTMVWVHDYADPYSDKSRPVVDELRKKYGNDLRIVFRDLVVHPQTATAGALAACAAHRQKMFARFDDVLWEKGYKARQFDKDAADGTHCWESADGCPVVLGFATELKLDVKKFQADMVACKPGLEADEKELQAFGVGATPTWFINGRFMSGAMPQENFEALIDEELLKATASKLPKAQYYKRAVLDKGLTKLEAPTNQP